MICIVCVCSKKLFYSTPPANQKAGKGPQEGEVGVDRLLSSNVNHLLLELYNTSLSRV